ncbi:hypothetical protein Bca52824_021371 [Brassica carinata]|uniref:Acyl carrier protein n=1 Tax=Brassica carinata TaxID=52824 RepID=A0A8X8AZG3_BRACI|nr:hypothetical protein Bca52824_021371 [Brassica carinata]
MATTFSSSLSMQATSLATPTTRISFHKPALVSDHGRTNLSFNLSRTRLSISCAVYSQEATLTQRRSKVVAETKFVDLGADSLDTVEIVMGLEEEFGIQMAEEKAQKIATVEQAAELIEELMQAKK